MKEAVKESMPFFRTIGLALTPWRYDEVGERTTRNLLKYFFSFVFLAFIVAVLLMLPAIAGLVTNQMSHFSVLEVSFNTSMKSPVVFPENRPFVTIDTRTSEGQLKEGRFLITDDYLYMKGIFGGVQKESMKSYKNLTANEGMVIFLLVMMMPSLMFMFYIGYAIWLMAIVLIAALLGFVIARVAKFDIPFLDAIKVGLLSATPMIIIDVIRLPLNLNVYFAQYIAFLVFFIVGIIKAGNFEGSRSSKRSNKGKYIDLTKNI